MIKSNLVLKTGLLGIILFSFADCWGSTTSSNAQVPVIKSIEWGKILVTHNGSQYQYRDAKLWPEKSKVWNWGETNTHHVPGIQVADLKEFIDDVDVVILTRGMDLALQIAPETVAYLNNIKKEYHIGETKEMVQLYNKLVKEGKRVGGVFHSTC